MEKTMHPSKETIFCGIYFYYWHVGLYEYIKSILYRYHKFLIDFAFPSKVFNYSVKDKLSPFKGAVIDTRTWRLLKLIGSKSSKIFNYLGQKFCPLLNSQHQIDSYSFISRLIKASFESALSDLSNYGVTHWHQRSVSNNHKEAKYWVEVYIAFRNFGCRIK